MATMVVVNGYRKNSVRRAREVTQIRRMIITADLEIGDFAGDARGVPRLNHYSTTDLKSGSQRESRASAHRGEWTDAGHFSVDLGCLRRLVVLHGFCDKRKSLCFEAESTLLEMACRILQ